MAMWVYHTLYNNSKSSQGSLFGYISSHSFSLPLCHYVITLFDYLLMTTIILYLCINVIIVGVYE